MKKCDDCFYFALHENKKTGGCLRYPPTPYMGRVGIQFIYPIVNTDDVCGEFKEGEEKKPELEVV